jgi:hypothetical protein
MPTTYKIGIFWISAKYTAFRNMSKDWLARNHVYQQTFVSLSEHYKNPIKRVGLAQRDVDIN